MQIAQQLRLLFLTSLLLNILLTADAQNERPNILLVITDDLGVDFSNGYHQANLMPNTPTLDRLRASGITFENVFAAPVCSPTRAAILSGKYGVKNGVLGVPGHLDTSHVSLFKALSNETHGAYADALIGKWHLSSPVDPQHPLDHGADDFMGVLRGAVNDYFLWSRTEDGQTVMDSSYVTSSFTDASIDWINAQTQPWFLWLAHVAPHSPFHTPPSNLYTIPNPGNNVRNYVAMVESVDTELDRLLKNIPEEVLENTIIIFVGDNGTPGAILQDYPTGHGKGSLYQGGIRVPMIVSGAGIERQGEREEALVHVADIYATILELAGAELPGGIHNSLSFEHLLKNEPGASRDYNYSEHTNNGENTFAIRNTRYKLIEFTSDGTQEFYDLLNDSLETNDLLNAALTAEQADIKADLEAEAAQIRTAWSCRDHIQNGDEEGIDCGGSLCAACTTSSGEPAKENQIRIFPNPASNILNIRSSDVFIREVKIFDAMGRLLWEKKHLNTASEQIELGRFPQQVLFVELRYDSGSKIERIVKL
ncbi:MAG: sulfatase-like hydrolase/transferase [Bacteroidota bacterium]